MKKNLRALRKAVLLLFVVLFCYSLSLFSQSTTNYTFNTGTNASLLTGAGGQAIDMSSGTTTVIGPGLTNFATAIFPLGFDFWCMNGASAAAMFSSFSVATNGMIGLNYVSNTSYQLGGVAAKFVSAFNAGISGHEMGTHSTGKIHYKVFGSFPYRVGVIEFFNMSIPRSSGTADATFQVRLYETTGMIEFVYGNMNCNTSLPDVRAGFSSGTTSNLYSTININNNTITTTSITSNTINSGSITNLNSPTEGSRRYYRFTPPVVNAPTMTISSPTAASVLLQVTPPAITAGIYGYAIYYSTISGGPYNFFAYLPGSSAVNTNLIGLMPGTTYYFKIAAVSEGSLALTNQASGTTASTPSNLRVSATSGNWNATTTWTGGVIPSWGDSVVISAGHTVTINANAITLSINVSGTLNFDATTSNYMSLSRTLKVSSGGTFNPYNGSTGRTVYVAGDIDNSGTIDFSKPSSFLILNGNSQQSINNSSGTFVGTSAGGSPANTGIIANLYLINPVGANLNVPLIVNTQLILQAGLLTTNNKLYIDNTQTYPGGAVPSSVTVYRYVPTAGYNGNVNYGSNATYNVSYPATVFGSSGTFIAGNEIPSDGIVNNLTMQVSGGVNFSNDLSIRNILTITGGNLNLGNKNLTLGTSAASPGALVANFGSSFIVTTGTLTRWFGTSPISLGNTTGYFPIAVGATQNRSLWLGGAPSSGGTLSVRFNDDYGTSVLSPAFSENSTLYNIRSNYNWQLSTGNGFNGTGLSIRMQGSNAPGIGSYAALTASLANGSAPGTFSAGTLANTDPQANRTGLVSTDLTNSFYFAGNNLLNPLPVTLVHFTGERKGLKNILSWSTASEQNNKGFELQRSSDSRNFVAIAFVASKAVNGNSSSVLNYQHSDEQPLNGHNYYRLKQVETDGDFSYSNVVTIKNSNSLNAVNLYPNPAKESIVLSIIAGKKQQAVYSLFDNTGRKLFSKTVSLNGGVNSINIPVHQLAAGSYILQVQGDEEFEPVKMIKE